MKQCVSVNAYGTRVSRSDIKRAAHGSDKPTARPIASRDGPAGPLAKGARCHAGRTPKQAGVGLETVLAALPPRQIKKIFCTDGKSLRALSVTSTAMSSLLRADYFWTHVPSPNTPKTMMQLAELGVDKDMVERIPVRMIMALANAYLSGQCSRRQCRYALKLLAQPRPLRPGDDDLAQMGLSEASRLIEGRRFLLDEWAVIGLMNGIIDVHDFAYIRPGVGIAFPEFWARRFPAMRKESPFALIPQDLRYIGVYTPAAIDLMRVGLLRDRPVTLEGPCRTNVRDVAETLGVYTGRMHYLLGIVAARAAGRSPGPLGGDASNEALNLSFQAAFGIVVEPAEGGNRAAAPATPRTREFCHLV